MTEFIVALFISGIMTKLHILVTTWVINANRNIAPIICHTVSATCILIILFFIFSICPVRFDLWLSFCSFALGVSTYLFLFGAVYKSLSLRMLLMIKENRGYQPLMQIDALITERSFEDRANILCSMGLVEMNGDVYEVTQKGLDLSNKIRIMRRLFHVSTTGLYEENKLINKGQYVEVINMHDL